MLVLKTGIRFITFIVASFKVAKIETTQVYNNKIMEKETVIPYQELVPGTGMWWALGCQSVRGPRFSHARMVFMA